MKRFGSKLDGAGRGHYGEQTEESVKAILRFLA